MEHRRKSILIVDDDRNILESLRMILESEDYDAEVAENGHDALEKFKARYFNMVLLDLRLPDIGGIELLNKMRKLQESKPTSSIFIIVTGFPSVGSASNAMFLGAHAYIVKPIKVDQFLKTVKEKLMEQEISWRISQKKMWNHLDEILNYLTDGKWQTLDNIALFFNTNREQIEEISELLHKHGIIEYDRDTGLMRKVVEQFG